MSTGQRVRALERLVDNLWRDCHEREINYDVDEVNVTEEAASAVLVHLGGERQP